MPGPIVLVGHSYGGSVITNAAAGNPAVTDLIYVAAFAPDQGETALELSNRFPGSTLGDALAPPVPLGDGTTDLFIRQDAYHAPFAADVPAEKAAVSVVTHRPIRDAALGEKSGAPGLDVDPVLVRPGRRRPEHPPRHPAVQGRTRRIPAHPPGRRCVARRRRLPPRSRHRHDRQSRPP